MLSKKIIASFLVATLWLVPIFPLLAANVSARPRIVINELQWMGSEASSSDEWIELRNFEYTSVDISGWKLSRRSSSSDLTMITLPTGSMIEPLGYFLIANYSETATTSTLGVSPDIVDPAVSLVNSGLQITLSDSSGAIIDVADDGSGAPLSGRFLSGTTYASMARNGLTGDGSLEGSWHVSRVASNIKSGSITIATPRAPNDNVPPNIAGFEDQSVVVGSSHQFDATDASDADGDTVFCSWDFGDLSSSVDCLTSHSYTNIGSYSVSLQLNDGIDVSIQKFLIKVASSPKDPSVQIGKVSISEILPNPVGPETGEFIELYSTDTMDLSNWKIQDESGTVYTIPAGSSIVAKTRLVFERSVTKISLNNESDAITLMNESGKVQEKIAYSGGDEGTSYAYFSSGWKWTTKPTPGEENIFFRVNHAPRAKFSVSPTASKRRAGTTLIFDASDSEDADADVLRMSWDFGDGRVATGEKVAHVYSVAGIFRARLTVRDSSGASDVDEFEFSVKEPLKGASKNAGSVQGAAVVTSILETKNAASSTLVEMRGWVTAIPGSLGNGIFFLTDGTNGIGVKLQSGKLQVKIGDAVTVHGEKRTTAGEAYVLVANAEDVMVGTAIELKVPTPAALQVGEIESERTGLLVEVVGEVTTLSGSRFSLDDGSGEIGVYVKSTTNIKRPAMRTGDRVRVVGILSSGSSGLRLLPRVVDDIQVIAAHQQSKELVAIPAVRKPPSWAYACLVIAGLIGYIIVRRRPAVKR